MLLVLRLCRGLARQVPSVITNPLTTSLVPSLPNLTNLSNFELAMQTRKLLIAPPPKSLPVQSVQQLWLTIQHSLLSRLSAPTTNPSTIRSLSMILYHVSKSKHYTVSFETQFALMLPFASPQSFNTIVTSISRMGGMSPQFRFLAKKQYEVKKDQMTVREKVSVNYALVKNGGEMDIGLYEDTEKMNLKELVTLMRLGEMTQTIDQDRLEKLAHHVALRTRETNVMDLSYSMQIFFKHAYLPEPLEKSINHAYRALKRNIDEHAFQRIWEHFPQAVNHNLLNIELVHSIILTLKKLYKKKKLNPQFIRKVKKDIETIENLEVRERCQLK